MKTIEKIAVLALILSGVGIILAMLLSVFKAKASALTLKRYVIPKGTHYPPSLSRALLRITPLPWFWFRKRKLVAYIMLPSNSLWDHNGNNDLRYDWNKLFGLNLRIWEPAHNWSCMAAFRCPSQEWWQATGYANKGSQSNREIGYDRGGGDEVFWPISPGEVFRVEVMPVGANSVMIEVWKNTSNSGWVVRRETYEYDVKMSFCGIVGPWFGGNLPAPKDIEIYMDWSIEKQ